MPTVSNEFLTLSDWKKSLDPNGQIARFIDLLSQSNEIILDAPFMEGNLEVGHQITALTGLPDVAYRMLNAGIPGSKATTAQYIEQTGMLEGYSRVDKDLAALGGNVNAFRMSKAKPFIEAMNQAFANRLFYGNVGTEPQAFTGLAPRYSSLTAGNAQNIIDAGGTGSDNASIWYVRWDPETVSCIFPKGSTRGLIHEDLREQLIENTNGVTGSLSIQLVDHWQWKHGLSLADWRFCVRIANIDVSNLSGGSAADLIDHMEHAIELIPNEMGRGAFYMNRTIRRFLRKQARADVSAGGGLTYENFDGKRILMFGDTPVRKCDQLVNTEAQVT